jgi:serine phosphatase RsbU (regulator of sigma subunit)
MDVLSHRALGALAAASLQVAGETGLDGALRAVGEAAADATGADVAVVRVADRAGELRVRAASARSEAVRAQLEGSRYPAAELPRAEQSELGAMPEAVRAAAARAGTAAALLLPVWIADRPAASLELMRDGDEFGIDETTLARLAAAQLVLALLALTDANGSDLGPGEPGAALRLVGEALSAGADSSRTADEIAHLAARATGAAAAHVWRVSTDEPARLLGSPDAFDEPRAFVAARQALDEGSPARVERALDSTLVTIKLGSPPAGVLQLVFSGDTPPPEAVVEQLAAFGVRAAHALRAGEHATEVTADLERTQALLAVVGQATELLSLAHTLETAADRLADLLGTDRVAIYLHDEGLLHPAHVRNVAGPHAAVAERLLELALGAFRAQGMLHVTDAAADLRLAAVRDAVIEAGIEAVVAVPLLVREDLIGLVALFLPQGHAPAENEATLLPSLAVQLAVAVQNAKLHEDINRLAEERKRLLDAEAARARQLAALHEISGSFATSLSLDATLDAVVRAAVELLGVDAAVIRVPDERGATLVMGKSHVRDPRLGEALGPLLERPQPLEGLPGRRLFRMGKALVLDPESADRLGASYELLVPFLDQGATVAVIPVALPSELLATLTVISLDPKRRLGDLEVETAVAVAGQAALAIDNARLYQQQKRFADTMQRSLLPEELPEIPGLELGAVYESPARVDVGGDVFDFLPLPGGRLVAVLGDVTGHGIEATADMALAKFVFRSLAREHPDPGDFLAHANAVACEEVAGGKFITMVCLAFDPEREEIAIARAGHPPARLLALDGSITELAPEGLALGIDGNQHYEELRVSFPPGTAVCLHTDGLLEARNGDEQFGEARLDAALAEARDLPADELARHTVAACRAFAAGDLVDDCAVVVIRRV